MAFNDYDIKYILGLRTTKLELDKMIGRINWECNLENSAKANPLQQQEKKTKWIEEIYSCLKFQFLRSSLLHLNQYKLYPQESFHYSQLEKLLDIDSEFVALLKLEVIYNLFDHWLVHSINHHQVRPYNNRDTIEEYRMVLYRYLWS